MCIGGFQRLNPGYAAVFMGPAVEAWVGTMLEGLEQCRGIALLQHELAHATGVAVKDLGVALVQSRFTDDAREKE